ncbi:cytochrome b [Paracoccaceae bacterium GXU_MW_L88]
MTPTLPLRDTPRVYGKITRALHWSMAVLMLFEFIGMGFKVLFGRDNPVASFLGGWHGTIGALLFVLIILRILWALTNLGNRPDHGDGPLGLAAKAGHGLLYVLMFLVPFAALARAYGSDRGFDLFGVQIFAPKTTEIGWTSALGNFHGEMGWVMGAIILGHIAMVGVHESMWRDGTLAKMAGRKRRV